ncbi:MAG TPA: thioredoxin family protein [Labilithrix sp.]|nr:thioredoxin family protein [Labilithrix sp.]
MARRSSVLALLVLVAGAAGTVGCGKTTVPLPMRWDGDLEAGLASAKAQNKPLFILFGAVWDASAKEIERVTLVDPQVGALLRRHFVSVYVDLSDWDEPRAIEATRRFGVVGEPVMLLLGPDGTTEIKRINQFIPPGELAPMLEAATREDAVREARFEAAIRRRSVEASRSGR